MEAIAKYNFHSDENDELSFSKEQVLKILNMEEDQNWYRAEYAGKEGFVPKNYIICNLPNWYTPVKSRTKAEEYLLEKSNGNYVREDGAFLVRPSESVPTDFSLSVKFGDTAQHFKILRDSAGKYFLWVIKFDSINKLVHYHHSASVSRSSTIFLQKPKTKAPTVSQTVAPAAAPAVLETAKALYDFSPAEDEEIELKRGDIIHVTDKTTDPNWWAGEIVDSNGCRRKGLFPKTYVELTTNTS